MSSSGLELTSISTLTPEHTQWSHSDLHSTLGDFPHSSVKNPPAMQETQVRSLGWEDPLEKGKATYSSILGWRIPWNV